MRVTTNYQNDAPLNPRLTEFSPSGHCPAPARAAAGHVSDGGGTGKNYTHLRPEYLKDFVAAVEAYWSEMDGLTRVHRSQVGPKVYDLAERKNMK